MRLALVMVLLVACGQDRPAAPPVDSAAGRVLSVEGQVTARRAAAGAPERALALDADVFADDTVTTAVAATVRIRLAHNQVVWNLEGGQSRRVDQSLAWKAPKGSASEALGAVEGQHAAAGRHAEQEAADTAGTAVRREAESASPAAPVAPPTAAAAPAPAASLTPTPAPPPPTIQPARPAVTAKPPPASPVAERSVPPPSPPKPARPDVSRPPAAPPPPTLQAPATTEAPVSPQAPPPGAVAPTTTTPPPPPPPPPPSPAPAPAAAAADEKPTKGGTAVPAARANGSVSVDSVEASGTRSPDALRSALASRQPALRACYQTLLHEDPSAAGHIVLSLTIVANGQVTAASASGELGDALARCAAARARTWLFPAAEGDVQVRVKLTFRPEP